MREIQAQQITDVVEKLCIEANQYLPEDVQGAIRRCRALLQILRSPKRKMSPSARIPAWPACSWRLDRMCISQAVI